MPNTNDKKQIFEALVNKKSNQDNIHNVPNEDDIEILEKLTKTKLYVKKNKKSNDNILDKLDNTFKSFVLDKQKYREDIRNKTKKFIKTYIIKQTKKEKDLVETTQKRLNDVSNFIYKIKNFTIESIDKIWKILKKSAKLITSTALKIYDFLLGPFKIGWKVFDKFLSAITPKTWQYIKNISSVVINTAIWVWDFGKKMLDFVWTGIKTIFRFGYEVMSTVAKTIYKGTKFLFSFWFRMLANTLFNPAMWIINVPIFVALTGVVFMALGTVSSLIIDLVVPVIKPLLRLNYNILNWIWSGITVMWKWIVEKYDGSWLQKFINEYIIDGMISWFMDIKVINKVINFIKIAYNWLKANGKRVFNEVSNTIKKVMSYFSKFNGESFLVKFINYFNESTIVNKLPGFSGFLKYLNSRYGFLPGIRIGGTLPSMDIKNVRSTLKTTSKQKIKTILEYESIRLLQSGKGDEEIKQYLLDNIVPQLENDMNLAGIKDNDLITIIEERLAISTKILKNESGSIKDYEKLLGEQTRIILKYDEILKQMKNGILDATSQETMKQLEKDRLDALQINKQFLLRVENESFSKTKKSALEILSNLQNYENAVKGSSRIKNYNSYVSLNTESKDISRKMAGISLTDIPDIFADQTTSNIEKTARTGLSIASVVAFKPLFITAGIIKSKIEDTANEIRKNELDSASVIDAQTRRFFTRKYERGGISSGQHENIQPLNDISANFIREKVKNLETKNNTPLQKNKEKSETKNNITIIDNTIIQEESYETYTISQLSRGLLAGG